MTISVSCDGCGKSYTVGDDKAGRRFSCKDCGDRVTVPDVEDEWGGEEYEEYDDGGDVYDDNPYAAPASNSPRRQTPRTSTGKQLASRLQRLGSAIMDSVIGLVFVIPAIIGIVLIDPEINPNPHPMGLVLIGIGGFMGLVLFVIQLYFLAKDGQTLGKKIGGCRIVDYINGSNPGLGRIFAMRILLPGIIGAVPCVGGIFSIVDILFIFGEEQRCLHDLMANTKVVEA